MLWEATFKAIACSATIGDEHRITVQAGTKEEAVTQARFHAQFERCDHYAITNVKEVQP